MIKKAYVDTPDGQLHYRYNTGEASGLPIVFIHQNGSSSEAFEAVLREMDGTARGYAFDYPNNGDSYKTYAKPTIAYIAQVVEQAMAALGHARFHIFGHHTGASVALELACSSPDAIASATLSGLTSVTPEEGAQYDAVMAFPNPPTLRGAQVMAAWSRTLTMEGEFIPYPPELRHREFIAMMKAGEQFEWGYHAVFADTVPEKMNRVQRPIFFLTGGLDPTFPHHMREVERHPEFPSYVNEQYGNFYADHDPADLVSHLLDFTRRHDG